MNSKRIFLTGASSGIGAATARWLTEQGHRVFLVSRNLQPMSAWVVETGQEHALTFEADVTDPNALKNAVNSMIEHWGGR